MEYGDFAQPNPPPTAGDGRQAFAGIGCRLVGCSDVLGFRRRIRRLVDRYPAATEVTPVPAVIEGDPQQVDLIS